MKKSIALISAVTFVGSNCFLALANDTDNLLGLRKYEEDKGHTVSWIADTKEITVKNGDDLLYKTNLGRNSIDLDNFSLQLDYKIQENDGVTYLKQETLDFMNKTLFNTQDIETEAYTIAEKTFESEGKVINYPEIQNYKGELIQDYMNQSINNLVKKYSENEMYKTLSLDYTVEKGDDKYISILFTGTATTDLFKEPVTIMDSITFDLATSNEFTTENFIKDKEKLDEILKSNSLNPLEYENLKFYFKGNDVVFYFMPLNDSAKLNNVIVVSLDELKEIVNFDLGEKPAS